MKKITWMWCFMAVLSLAVAGFSQSSNAVGGIEKAVTGLEEQWTQAQTANDPDAAAPLFLADDFKYVTSNGKVVTKTEFLAKLKTLKYDTVTFEDVKVTALGSTAVAIGVYMARGTDASGRSFDFRERAVDTWVKMPDGQWKCVASVGTPLKM